MMAGRRALLPHAWPGRNVATRVRPASQLWKSLSRPPSCSVICGLLLAFLVAKKNAVAASNFEAATVLARGTLERISTTSYASIASYGPVAITSGNILSQIQGGWIQVAATNVTGMKQVRVTVKWTNLTAESCASLSLATAVSGY